MVNRPIRLHRVLEAGEDALAQLRHHLHVPQVHLRVAGHAGVLHLDRHLLARLQLASVHLRQRGAADGLALHLGEQLARIRAQILLDHAVKITKGNG